MPESKLAEYLIQHNIPRQLYRAEAEASSLPTSTPDTPSEDVETPGITLAEYLIQHNIPRQLYRPEAETSSLPTSTPDTPAEGPAPSISVLASVPQEAKAYPAETNQWQYPAPPATAPSTDFGGYPPTETILPSGSIGKDIGRLHTLQQQSAKWIVLGMPRDAEGIKKAETMSWSDVIRDGLGASKFGEGNSFSRIAEDFAIETLGGLADIYTSPTGVISWELYSRALGALSQGGLKALQAILPEKVFYQLTRQRAFTPKGRWGLGHIGEELVTLNDPIFKKNFDETLKDKSSALSKRMMRISRKHFEEALKARIGDIQIDDTPSEPFTKIGEPLDPWSRIKYMLEKAPDRQAATVLPAEQPPQAAGPGEGQAPGVPSPAPQPGASVPAASPDRVIQVFLDYLGGRFEGPASNFTLVGFRPQRVGQLSADRKPVIRSPELAIVKSSDGTQFLTDDPQFVEEARKLGKQPTGASVPAASPGSKVGRPQQEDLFKDQKEDLVLRGEKERVDEEAAKQDAERKYRESQELLEKSNLELALWGEGGQPKSLGDEKLTPEQAKQAVGKMRKTIKMEMFAKKLSPSVLRRLKRWAGITEWKNATSTQCRAVIEQLNKLRHGDKFLTDKQVVGLRYYFERGNFGKPNGLVTVREFQQKFKEPTEAFDGLITSWIPKKWIPSVDIKQGHPVVERFVNLADNALREMTDRTKEVDEGLKVIMKAAKRLRKQGLWKYRSGAEIWKELSGMSANLTEPERQAAEYMQRYFDEARLRVNLERTRTNYITHMEKKLMEKIANYGIFEGIRRHIKAGYRKPLPREVMNALDHIIGTKKFFQYALPRKGGVDPTMNVERIMHDYARIVEMKVALDKILPEGEAIVQLLLQPKTATWMQAFVQNLKGRGLDFRARNGEERWMLRLADRAVNSMYALMLGANIMAPIKNIIGGEANSFIWQTFEQYLRGKARLMFDPKKAYRMIVNNDVAEGAYMELAKQSFTERSKTILDTFLFGGMQSGEFEIRGSMFLGYLTPEEWRTEVISGERMRYIMDQIARTQGVFTKAESPLAVQTATGRMAMLFGRWKLTNLMMFRDICKGAKAEWGKGEYNGTYTHRLLKMLMVGGAAMYLGYEFGKRDYRKAKQLAMSAAQIFEVLYETGTLELFYNARAHNPVIERLGEVVHTMQTLASFLTGGLIEGPSEQEYWRHGIEETIMEPPAVKQMIGMLEDDDEAIGAGTLRPSSIRPRLVPGASYRPASYRHYRGSRR